MKQFFLISFLFFAVTAAFSQNEKSRKFDFGAGKALAGYTKISSNSVYTSDKGYGIDLNTSVFANEKIGKRASTDGYLTSDRPYYFSLNLPEGNYRVKVTVGDDSGTSDVAIRAEDRRMMVNRVQTAKGEHKTIEFTVNIRDSLIAGTNAKVRLKPRELSYLNWDNRLTLEFNSAEPKVNSIEIFPEKENVVSVFLAGNSTVVDQPKEPFSAWGQMFPSFFKTGKVAIVNLAESGETLKSFIGARRLTKILQMMKPGDYVFVEFGHNDQKEKGEGVGAFTTYKKTLEYFINEVKKKRGIPILVTSVQRRNFDVNGKIVETLGDYPEAVRQTAQEHKVALIDLNAMSTVMFESMGEKESLLAFVHFPANSYPGMPGPMADNTHFRPYGAFEVSRLLVQGVRNEILDLARFIKKEVPVFKPDMPDAYLDFYWPESPSRDGTKPAGN
ncbi:rhamnogalacturonan acetylesterase [Daejeonella sp.]|uniref:rhamnogalacturonan acetylesterase n=1 Tax=Daejeonella sp. TaxID=2805397 RepID=UPI0039835504